MALPTICLIRPDEGVARKAGFMWRSGLAIRHVAPELAKRGVLLTDEQVPDACAYRFQAIGWNDFPMMARLKQWGAKIIADVDDHPYIWPPLPDIPAQFQALVKAVRGNVALKGLWDRWISFADAISTTTADLRAMLLADAPPAGPYHILPNLIDLDDFKNADLCRESKRIHEVTILYFGSPSHLQDLMQMTEPLSRILDKYPHVRLVVWGSYMPGPMEQAAKRFGDRWIYKAFTHYDDYHREFMAITPDIGLCPLDDNPFARGRSPIKWFEYTLAGAATIASDVDLYRPYVKYRCKPDEWYDRIAELIENQAARQVEQQRSLEAVREEHCWQSEKSRRPWLEFFEGLVA